VDAEGDSPLSDDAALRAIVEGVEAEVGDRFFGSLVRHLAQALGARYAFVSALSEDRSRFRTLAVWGPGGRLDDFEVPVAGTPCEAVLDGEMAHHPERLQQLFPEDVGLVTWNAESYCGVPVLSQSGVPVGHLAIFDDKPMRDPRGVSIMRIFAARARAEVERLRAEQALRDSEQRLASILASAMDAIVTFDADGRVELFNAAAERLLGCPAAAALGGPVERFLGERLREAVAPALAAGDGHGNAYLWAPGGLSARRADGGEIAVEATLSQAESGGRRLHTLTLRDVEERRRAEQELRRLHEQNAYLLDEIRAAYNADEIVGAHGGLRAVLERVALVGPADSSVLILGETGTGKELVARAVHAASRRRARPLIKVNCAALPAGLIESELFGHERGAFTGATEKRVGRFELAAGGTIFLDEIGDMPLEVQAKLLRVLQEREFERVGGSRTIAADVRVIAATNRDLARAVGEGRFRQDLFYRLNVVPIEVPPLRRRREDVPLLVHWFVGRFAQKTGRNVRRVPAEAMARLQAYDWPGNVRELENVIERAVILARGEELEVPAELVPGGPAAVAPGAPVSIEEVERAHIARVLAETEWRIDGPEGAARILGLNPSTLRSRIKKLGLRRAPASGVRE